MDIAYSLKELLALAGDASVEGQSDSEVTGIASLKEAEAGDLSFLGNKKYTPDVAACEATVILLPKDFEGAPKEGQVFIRVENPSLVLARLCGEIESNLWPKPEPGVHPSAVIDATATLGENVTIGPNCVVEAGASIGAFAHLQANVFVGRNAKVGAKSWLRPFVSVMDYCELQERVRLHSGVVVGSDGFGYEVVEGRHEKVPQVGNVVVENDVEIGANTTIDRARFRSTVIGEGTKIDNLVQIAHNVIVGKHCLLVSQAGISGSTVLEDYVVVAGQAGITGHLKLGKGTVVGAQCGLHYNTQPGTYHRGTPGNPAMLANKIDVLRKKLPDLFKRVSHLEQSLETK